MARILPLSNYDGDISSCSNRIGTDQSYTLIHIIEFPLHGSVAAL